MTKAIVIEGARGTLKSTVARLLRNKIEGSTLMNLTGFKEDGEAGHAKIVNYYDALFKFIDALEGDQTLIFDRIFFTEMVMSPLYKRYDFKKDYERLCEKLACAFDELEIFTLTIRDEAELSRRLNRNKLPLFGHIPENVVETMKQQKLYEGLMEEFSDWYLDNHAEKGASILTIDTTVKSAQDVADIIHPF